MIHGLGQLDVPEVARAFIHAVPLPDLVVGAAAGLARVPTVERAHAWVVHTAVHLRGGRVGREGGSVREEVD